MGQQRFDKPDDWQNIRQVWVFDDFVAYLDALTWTKGTSGTGTTVIINNVDDQSALLLGNAGSTSGAEAWFASTNKFWKWKSNHPTHMIASVNIQEANTNNCSIFVGYSDSFATGLVTNANPNAFKASSTSCGFFLPSGATTWSVVLAVAGAATVTATLENAISTAAFTDQYLMVQADIVGTNIEATFMTGQREAVGGADSTFAVGWQQCRESASGYNKPIKLRAAIGSAAAMGGGVYLRQTSTTAETARCDMIGLLNPR